MRNLSLLLRPLELYVLCGTYYTVLKTYKLNIFNTKKVSTEQIIAVNVFHKTWID